MSEQRREGDSSNHRRWLIYAQEDIALAQRALEDEQGTPRHACMLSQHAAEKAIKALLLSMNIEFPKPHDLERLITLLPPSLRALFADLPVTHLSEWAIETRYPGDWPEATSAEARMAVDIATRVIRLVSNQLAQSAG